mgnify:CR=1 FL=1
MDNSPKPFMPTSVVSPRVHSGNVALDFLWWYIVLSPRNIIAITDNFLIANFNFFSISRHLHTLFAYWHRDFEVYGGGVDIERYFGTIIINTLSRIVGFLIRSITIIAGLLIEVLIAMLGILWLLLWFTIPFLLFFAFSHEPESSISFPHLFSQLSGIFTSLRHGIF